MSEIELLPCAHCGAEAIFHENDWCEPSQYGVHCTDWKRCGAQTGGFMAKAAAIAAWNRRGMEEAKIIDRLLTLVYQVWCALDDSEVQQDDSIIVTPDNAKALNDALDAFDELPDDQPGYTMGPAAKARWALRSLIGTGDTSALSAPPAEEGLTGKRTNYRGGKSVNIEDWPKKDG